MMTIIKQFMWGYQQHFRISASRVFERIAGQIGASVTPTVFLVGIAHRDDAQHSVCVEPEEGIRYSQSTFTDVTALYESARGCDPRAGIFQSHPVAQENEKRRLHSRSLMSAIISCVNKQDADANLTFCSPPVPVGPYEICVVLLIPREQVGVLPTLVTTERSYSTYHVYPLTQSLLHAVANVFLEKCFQALWMPDATFLECDIPDLAREAGRRMMEAPSTLGAIGDSLDSASLFDACNIISGSRYEGTPSVGGMLISQPGHAALHTALTLAQPVSLTDHRGTRKLLEFAIGDHSLLCDGKSIYGIGSLKGSYNNTAEDVFHIRFASHYTWELMRGPLSLMVVEYGHPHLPRLPFNVAKFLTDLPRFFPNISAEEVERLVTIVLGACDQQHGTTVLISAYAAEEAQRLAGQGTLIFPTAMNADLVSMVTAIDGAVLLDPSGICHAIGVILDGPATQNGNPSRGGRYNSAVRYTEAHANTLAVVVSADATVDVVPDLRTRIDRREVDAALTALTQLAEQTQVDPRDHNVAVSRLDKIRFYLTDEDCKRANSLLENVRSKVNFGLGDLIISMGAFCTHPDMNPRYYLI